MCTTNLSSPPPDMFLVPWDQAQTVLSAGRDTARWGREHSGVWFCFDCITSFIRVSLFKEKVSFVIGKNVHLGYIVLKKYLAQKRSLSKEHNIRIFGSLWQHLKILRWKKCIYCKRYLVCGCLPCRLLAGTLDGWDVLISWSFSLPYLWNWGFAHCINLYWEPVLSQVLWKTQRVGHESYSK